jgi:nicotinate phosphoribosyltransferase
MNANVSVLLTDLYMLTMLEGLFREGMDGTASYELFVRDLPPDRGFLLAAGLEQALQYLEGAHFTEEDVDWLRHCGHFSPKFVDHLATWRFAGDVDAIPEGTVFFPNEPILRVTAPISQAQFVESRLINLLHLQTVIASKAARCRLAAPGKMLVDFGLRHAHGAEAGLMSARASYIAGFNGTATVLAGKLFDIPVYGTMAHAYVQAHDTESAAFESFARAQPDNVVLLIDTYDTEQGAKEAVAVASLLRQSGIAVKAVRIDSGDLAEHAVKVRRILDEGGLKKTEIFSSGNLDEYTLRDLLNRGAPIDGFGVGTRLDTSSDAPYLECVYKLVEYEGQPRRKRSENKVSWPGRKQVYRQFHKNGSMHSDIITVEGDNQPGEPLIEPVMRAGRRLRPPESLSSLRERAKQQLNALPPHLRTLQAQPAFQAGISPALHRLAARADEELAQRQASSKG